MDGRLQRVDLSSRNWWKSIIFVRDRFLTLKKISSKGKKEKRKKSSFISPSFYFIDTISRIFGKGDFPRLFAFPFFKKIGLFGLQQATRPINHSVLAEFLLLLLSFLAQPSLTQPSPRFRSNFARNNYSPLLEPNNFRYFEFPILRDLEISHSDRNDFCGEGERN